MNDSTANELRAVARHARARRRGVGWSTITVAATSTASPAYSALNFGHRHPPAGRGRRMRSSIGPDLDEPRVRQ